MQIDVEVAQLHCFSTAFFIIQMLAYNFASATVDRGPWVIFVIDPSIHFPACRTSRESRHLPALHHHQRHSPTDRGWSYVSCYCFCYCSGVQHWKSFRNADAADTSKRQGGPQCTQWGCLMEKWDKFLAKSFTILLDIFKSGVWVEPWLSCLSANILPSHCTSRILA